MSNPEKLDVTTINEEFADKRPKDLIKHAIETHGKIAVSFSGAEDVVLVDMATKIDPNVQVFCLDTGRLHPETYQFIEKVRKHYKIQIELMSPEQAALEAFSKEKGLFSFYEDGHKECCGVRKIAPLKRKLTTLDAWVTGQRKDQSPGTRTEIALCEEDNFPGAGEVLYKYNPLANWTSAQVWEYIKIFDVPFNELHNQGYISIGCEPCTRPVLPNQHEREGRWWWEGGDHKECGLHAGNIIGKG